MCNTGFTVSTALKIHQRKHTGDKPYGCDLCNKTFYVNIVNAHLERHKRIHTGDKPFECSVCNKTFISKDSLKDHETIHTGAKPFTCSLCNKKFSLGRHLRRRQRLIHNDH